MVIKKKGEEEKHQEIFSDEIETNLGFKHLVVSDADFLVKLKTK